MKRTVLVPLALVILLSQAAFALETGLMDTRNHILLESQEIKSLLTDTKDSILVSSMWDSCVMTLSQLDAYFSQMGIFNTIKKEDVSNTAIDFLVKWLNGIKSTDDVNIKSLDAVTQKIQARTKFHLEKLKGYFTQLDRQIDAELDKLADFKKTLIKK